MADARPLEGRVDFRLLTRLRRGFARRRWRIASLSSGQAKKKDEILKKVKDAIAAMKETKGDLGKGQFFGGHKKKAIEALNVAIEALEAAVKFAEENKK